MFINSGDNTYHLPLVLIIFILTTITMHKKCSKIIMLKIWHIKIEIKDKVS